MPLIGFLSSYGTTWFVVVPGFPCVHGQRGGVVRRFNFAQPAYAVRAIRAGAAAEIASRQLGHANPLLVHKVYRITGGYVSDRNAIAG